MYKHKIGFILESCVKYKINNEIENFLNNFEEYRKDDYICRLFNYKNEIFDFLIEKENRDNINE